MAYLLLILTPLFWAGNMVSTRAIADQSDPILLALLRWSVAFLLVAPWCLPALKRQWSEICSGFPVLVGLSLLSVAGFNTFIYLGVQTTTATNAVLLQAIIPILILLFNRILHKESISHLQWLGILLSVLGVSVLVARGDLQRLLNLSFTQGDLWILVAVVSWALYSVCLRYKPQSIEPFTFFSFSVLFGVIVLLPFALWEQGGWVTPQLSGSVWLVVLYIAIFPSILAYLFWNRGVAELGASTAGLFIYLIPVFGLMLAVLFLKERLELFHLTGILLIISGIWLAIFQRLVRQSRNN